MKLANKGTIQSLVASYIHEEDGPASISILCASDPTEHLVFVGILEAEKQSLLQAIGRAACSHGDEDPV